MKNAWISLPVAALCLTLAACNTKTSDAAVVLPPLAENPLKVTSRWSTSVGKGAEKEALFLEPAVESPAVYAVSRDGVVKSVGRASGKARWQIKLSSGVTGGVAVKDGLLALGTDQADLLLLNANNGNPIWRASLGATLLAAPRITDKDVVVQTLDGRVQVFERSTGKRRWQFDTPVPPLSLRGNAAPVISGDFVYAVSGQGDLYQLDLATGLPIWQTRVTNSRGRGEIERLMDIDGDLVLDANGTIYTAGYQSQLTATDTLQVRRRWQLNVSTTQAVAVDAAHVYAVDVNGSVAGINKLTGELIWVQDFKGLTLSTPVIWRGLVVVVDNNGMLHAMSPRDGAVRARTRVAKGPLMSIVVDAPQLLTLSTTGQLRAWDINP
ncbi:MAG: outer membrane protein assembly factor BamB [Moraxellaceae bacterium]|nr:outer membrane protein assembly factor BamB [Moraxellaceae bacterium]